MIKIIKKDLIVILLILIAIPIYPSYLDDHLWHAVVYNKFDKVKNLIKKGADVNAKTESYGDTILMKACEIGKNLDIVKYLIKKGADVSAKDDEEYTVLMHAVFGENPEILEYILKKYSKNINDTDNFWGNTALIWAAIRNDLEIVKILIEKKADIDAKSFYYEYTALMKACEFGNIEIVKYLLIKGAKLNIQDKDGNTALMFALQSDHSEIAEYLNSKGAK